MSHGFGATSAYASYAIDQGQAVDDGSGFGLEP